MIMHRRGSHSTSVGITLLLSSCVLVQTGLSLTLKGTESSYASFPSWEGCPTGFFSFDFKTKQGDALLWYVDDRGRYDFFELTLTDGRARLALNVVDGRDGRTELVHGSAGDDRLDDDRWHRVEVRRNRLETLLTVDGLTVRNASSGGNDDFDFGAAGNDSRSPAFVGGVPPEMTDRLDRLSLPSVVYRRRFEGSVRNVFYSDCRCETRRVRVVGGVDFAGADEENCLRRPTTEEDGDGDGDGDEVCPPGCLCISGDQEEPECDCSQLHCSTGGHRTL